MSSLRRISRSPALLAALAVLVIGSIALSAIRSSPRLSLRSSAAIRDAHRFKALASLRYTRISVSPVDSRLVRVTFYDGAQIAAQVAVRPDGSVAQAAEFSNLNVPYGDWIAYEPAVLGALASLFLLMTAVVPLRRLRNLDVLAALSLVAPAVLLQHRYIDASAVAAAPGLGYLMVRCCWAGLGSASRPRAPSIPVFDHVTPRLGATERARVLRALLLALSLVVAMVGFTSLSPVDVIFAVMEGATKLIHGVLPYGHLPGDVVHGDTYPILSYALYAPLALLAPVHSDWDSVDLALVVSVGAAVLCAGAAYVATAGGVGRTWQRRAIGGGDPGAQAAGLRAALAFLSFPLVMITVSTGTTDVVLALMLLVAVLAWRRPATSMGWLAAAGWFKLAPFALIPIWLAPLRGRRLRDALAMLAAVSLSMLAVVLAVGGAGGVGAMIHALSFQFSRGSPQSVWASLGIESLQPIAEAGVLALIAAATVRLRREPELAADRARIAALSAAVVIGLQLAASYWAFLYVIWIMPLLGLSLLAERAPAQALEPIEVSAALPALAAG